MDALFSPPVSPVRSRVVISLILGFGALLSLGCATSVLAADAVFSPDAKSVTLLPFPQVGKPAPNQLWRVDLETKGLETVTFDLPKDHAIRSLALGAEGELLLLTDQGVYVHSAKGTKKLCDIKGVADPADLAVVPPNAPGETGDWLIVTGIDKRSRAPQKGRVFYGRKPGGKAFEAAFARRITDTGGAGFTRDGRAFFVADGTLWEGKFQYEPDWGGDPLLLNGASIAPLAFQDTTISNFGSWNLTKETAVTGKSVYVPPPLKARSGSFTSVAIRPKPAVK